MVVRTDHFERKYTPNIEEMLCGEGANTVEPDRPFTGGESGAFLRTILNDVSSSIAVSV